MTKEVWKFWKETNCHRFGKLIYEVSNYGRVKINGEIIEPKLNHYGYKILCSKYLLHRIVAELFIPNPYNLPCVDHIDTNRLNNRVDNLRWVSYKENSNNPLTIYHNKNTRNKPILQYTKDDKFIAEYSSAREAERQTDVKRPSIIICCKNTGRLKSAGGYIWKYKNI